MKAHIFVLCYGKEHADLHSRVLSSVHRCAPLSVAVSVHGNQIPEKTIAFASSLAKERGGAGVFRYTEENIPKYKVMREFFSPNWLGDAEWVVWFDDDSHVVKSDWWKVTCDYIATRPHEGICYIGQPWYVHWLPGQWEFIQKSSWYKGKDPELIRGKPGVTFATGGYFWLRADVLRMLDWPPVSSGLSHNGGDCLLSEAVRQQGRPFHKFHYGVKINDAKRRGLSEAPVGCTDKSARR